MTIAAEHHRFIMTDGSSSGDANRCPNSWFGAHKMEPRYDIPTNPLAQIYVRDICVKCGKTIERVTK